MKAGTRRDRDTGVFGWLTSTWKELPSPPSCISQETTGSDAISPRAGTTSGAPGSPQEAARLCELWLARREVQGQPSPFCPPIAP